MRGSLSTRVSDSASCSSFCITFSYTLNTTHAQRSKCLAPGNVMSYRPPPRLHLLQVRALGCHPNLAVPFGNCTPCLSAAKGCSPLSPGLLNVADASSPVHCLSPQWRGGSYQDLSRPAGLLSCRRRPFLAFLSLCNFPPPSATAVPASNCTCATTSSEVPRTIS